MKQYNVTGMSCAACSARVEKAVNKVLLAQILHGYADAGLGIAELIGHVDGTHLGFLLA